MFRKGTAEEQEQKMVAVGTEAAVTLARGLSAVAQVLSGPYTAEELETARQWLDAEAVHGLDTLLLDLARLRSRPRLCEKGFCGECEACLRNTKTALG